MFNAQEGKTELEIIKAVREQQMVISSIVHTSYDFQKLRIQIGNRLYSAFRENLNIPAGTSESDADAKSKDLLDKLRKEYNSITEGIADTGIPSLKKFKPEELINKYGSLVLVDQWIRMEEDETKCFVQLGKVLEEYPLYTDFLKHIDGMGVQMSGVLMSEIDISRSKYASSIWKLAGLDVVKIGRYTDDAGNEQVVSGDLVDAYYTDHDPEENMVIDGKYLVSFKHEGRSMKKGSLVQREYVKANGTVGYKMSITFNPWLKSKLIGVLANGFIKASKTKVNGEKLGLSKRLALAKSEGFKPTSSQVKGTDIDLFLIGKGYDVVFEPTKYGKCYYDYKNRLDNSPNHKEKTPLHKHNMALRYMIKMFLIDYYRAARSIAGLPVHDTYAEAKLGLHHGVDVVA